MKPVTSDILVFVGVAASVWSAVAATPWAVKVAVPLAKVAVPLAIFYAGYRFCQIRTARKLEKQEPEVLGDARLYLQEIAWKNDASIGWLVATHPTMQVYIERAIDELVAMRLVHKLDGGGLELTERGRRYVTDHRMVPQVRVPFHRM
jgi:hypothetical protein